MTPTLAAISPVRYSLYVATTSKHSKGKDAPYDKYPKGGIRGAHAMFYVDNGPYASRKSVKGEKSHSYAG